MSHSNKTPTNMKNYPRPVEGGALGYRSLGISALASAINFHRKIKQHARPPFSFLLSSNSLSLSPPICLVVTPKHERHQHTHCPNMRFTYLIIATFVHMALSNPSEGEGDPGGGGGEGGGWGFNPECCSQNPNCDDIPNVSQEQVAALEEKKEPD